ncbi:hypothetical protein FB446DRAFT_633597 [Lentinula raphanica]|nr:hypothetical protein C8R42DRAFT_585445 [Lentinula raphanica]KAJ3777671.1 hypothetical protein FB446DRAFT_633597 [Lentinula raphanica]
MDSLPSSSAGTIASVEASQRSSQQKLSQKTYDSQRPSGSSVLWAHLLRKDVLPSPANADLPLPPLAPVDKSATSTRILLLDTQAQLQKFGQAVDGLTSRVDSAKHEINLVKTLFKQDREVLMNDIVDRVNRSQSEIQKSIGKPAQASKLEDIEKNLDLRLDNMNQRLDAMQMVNHQNSICLDTFQVYTPIALSDIYANVTEPESSLTILARTAKHYHRRSHSFAPSFTDYTSAD